MALMKRASHKRKASHKRQPTLTLRNNEDLLLMAPKSNFLKKTDTKLIIKKFDLIRENS
jgi:hypothetical protein